MGFFQHKLYCWFSSACIFVAGSGGLHHHHSWPAHDLGSVANAIETQHLGDHQGLDFSSSGIFLNWLWGKKESFPCESSKGSHHCCEVAALFIEHAMQIAWGEVQFGEYLCFGELKEKHLQAQVVRRVLFGVPDSMDDGQCIFFCHHSCCSERTSHCTLHQSVGWSTGAMMSFSTILYSPDVTWTLSETVTLCMEHWTGWPWRCTFCGSATQSFREQTSLYSSRRKSASCGVESFEVGAVHHYQQHSFCGISAQEWSISQGSTTMNSMWYFLSVWGLGSTIFAYPRGARVVRLYICRVALLGVIRHEVGEI